MNVFHFVTQYNGLFFFIWFYNVYNFIKPSNQIEVFYYISTEKLCTATRSIKHINKVSHMHSKTNIAVSRSI